MQDSRIDLPASAGLEPHEGVWEIVFGEVVLRRKIIGLGLATLSYQTGECIVLMKMMRDGPHVVEEFAKQIPAALARHDVGAQQKIAGYVDRSLEQESIGTCGAHVAQSFVF